MSSLVAAKWVSSAMRVEAQGVQPLAHEVLDGLHVVLGGRLELREPVDLGLAEVVGERAQRQGLLVRRGGWSRTSGGR